MSHIDRMRQLGNIALPNEDSPLHDIIVKKLKKHDSPDIQKRVGEAFNKAFAIVDAQRKNGANLPIDIELRYYLEEFNSRAWKYGLRTMPVSFNVMEAFFTYNPQLNSFFLLDEEDFLIDFIDFIDYATSKDCPNKIEESLKLFDEDRIYNFTVTNNPPDIDFSLLDNKIKYAIGGVSMIKRGDEVSMILLAGEKNSDLSLPPLKETKRIPGKSRLEYSPDRVQEKVRFWDDEGYWKTIILLRFDVLTMVLDAKFINKDMGNSFSVLTDYIESFLSEKGEFLFPEAENYLNEQKVKIQNYYPLFEIARTCLHLLSYVEKYTDSLSSEEHITVLGHEPIKPRFFKKDKMVPPKYELRKRDVWNLKRQRDNYSSSIITFNDDFKLETSGYWKSLKPNEIGQNKNGDEIHGKTWVSITKTWHETENKPIKITNNIKTLVNSVNSGFIYIMRNASHEKNIFKVGLTRRDCETRAKELSSATGVPDKYLIVEEFATADCVLAEKLIHERLDDYRLNNKREFFKANYSFIRATINEIVNEINGNT